MIINTIVEHDHQEQEISIVLETDTDYREAIAALDEQINVVKRLMDSVVMIAEAINVYEIEHDIEQIQDDN